VARPVCSECGADLVLTQASCVKCGAAIEWESMSAEQQRQTSDNATEAGVCDVCGHRNTQQGMYCESCGARLSGTTAARTPGAGRSGKEPKKPEGEQRSKKNRKKKRAAESKRVDPLVIGAAVVVAAIVGYFAYSEITRETPKLAQAPHESLAPETASMIKEVERLQGIVDANPSDAPSLLRLANTLHDLSLQDARLLLRTIDTYDRYLALRPDDPNARVDLGIVYFELARVDSVNARELVAKSIHEMETVARAHPDHQPAAFNLGIVNLNSGNTDESAKWFKKAIAINENSDLGARAKRLLEQHSFSATN
jgi:DNA-directed RNA polymerase subunit RPC12/RpoP